MKAGDFFGEIGILNLDGLNKYERTQSFDLSPLTISLSLCNDVLARVLFFFVNPRDPEQVLIFGVLVCVLTGEQPTSDPLDTPNSSVCREKTSCRP